jgi:hypothetical protein
MEVDIVLHQESKLNQTPRVIRSIDVYELPNKNICAGHLVEQLRKLKAVHDECSLSYYLKNRNAYVFGSIVPKEGLFLPSGEEIHHKFLNNNTVMSG